VAMADGRRVRPLVVGKAVFEPSDLSELRGRLSGWLDRQGWPAVDRMVLVQAVSEAGTLALQRAYPPLWSGPLSVHAVIWSNDALRYAVVQVRDEGERWAPADSDIRYMEIEVVRTLVDHVAVRSDATGTTLTLTSSPVPPLHVPSLGGSDRPRPTDRRRLELLRLVASTRQEAAEERTRAARARKRTRHILAENQRILEQARDAARGTAVRSRRPRSRPDGQQEGKQSHRQ
jgi:anti-sigma regulatory factor (Ser/Thr protein kinase)